jgi:hypothetical protein
MIEIHVQQGVDNGWWSLGFCNTNIEINYLNETINKRDHVKENYNIFQQLLFLFFEYDILQYM